MNVLHLERPSFWTETRDGEAWFRALAALSVADPARLVGSPRSVWQHTLSNLLSRRTALGLFGAATSPDGTTLYGAGLVEEASSAWRVNERASGLVARWQSGSPGVIEDFATFLVRNSVWLRCLLCRLLDGDWELANWPRVRQNRRGLKPGESIALHRFAEPERWIEGLAQRSARVWLERTGCDEVAVHPDVLGRGRRRDDLSLAPLTAPLHLLEAIGWLGPHGELLLPDGVRADLSPTCSPARELSKLTAESADLRGFVPAEPVLRELLASFGSRPSESDFSRWMDHLIERSVATGAVEILSAEPGQARHGRGLLGDPARKLVRWVVHPEFDDLFKSAWATLGNGRLAHDHGPGAPGEELSR